MKECELCDVPARMYCESDQASLCWDCDAKVHCANFLVARHLRNLLCHVCQSPTPWKASGSKLGPTVSICDRCFSRRDGRKGRTEEEESEGETDGRDGSNEEEEEEEEDDDEDHDDGGGGGGDGEEADGENQVVPWSSTPPPAASSSSSSGESSSGEACAETTMAVSLKRMRGNADLCFLEDLDSSSSHQHYNAESAAAAARRSAEDEATSSRPSKHRKKDPMPQPAQATGSRTALIGSMQRYQQDTRLSKVSSDEDVLHICKLSRDPTAVDLVSTSNHSPPI